MKCRSLFSEKIRKNIANLPSAELVQRVVKVKTSTLITCTKWMKSNKCVRNFKHRHCQHGTAVAAAFPGHSNYAR